MKIINRIVLTAISLILFFAAFEKINHVLSEPIITPGFCESGEFSVLQIPLLLGLAIWLVSGLFRKAAWMVAVIAFIVFSADTTYKLISGAASCGCFGKVEVNPAITLFAINLPALIMLLIFRPKGEKLFPSPWPKFQHITACAVPTFLLLGFVLYTTWTYEPPAQTDEYEVVTEQSWIGEEFPMLDHIDVGDQLRQGLSVIFFYHFDCPDCREDMPIYSEMYESVLGDQNIKFAFIEMPPYGSNQEESPVPIKTNCILGKLSTDKKWYAASPLVVVTQDSLVLKVWQMEVPLDFNDLIESAME